MPECVMSWVCHIMSMSCNEYVMSWVCHVMGMSYNMYVTSLVCHVMSVSCHEYVMSWVCHVMSVLCHEYVMLWVCHVTSMSCHEYVSHLAHYALDLLLLSDITQTRLKSEFSTSTKHPSPAGEIIPYPSIFLSLHVLCDFGKVFFFLFD